MMTAFTKNKKAKTLTLDYGTKMKVVVSKSDVKDAAKADLDFSVTGKNFISSKSINKNKTLSKAEKVVQMKFVNDGKIKGIEKVTINRRVGKSYAGQKAVVYEYTDGKLVKIATVKVNKNGYVSFKTDHLGKFVIAVY
ncbi:MAG: hypothetical protein K2J11_00465 [Oscillospiraceae bacterium]|nr:hypothetical protein [Oscillospiraceae bacterium]